MGPTRAAWGLPSSPPDPLRYLGRWPACSAVLFAPLPVLPRRGPFPCARPVGRAAPAPPSGPRSVAFSLGLRPRRGRASLAVPPLPRSARVRACALRGRSLAPLPRCWPRCAAGSLLGSPLLRLGRPRWASRGPSGGRLRAPLLAFVPRPASGAAGLRARALPAGPPGGLWAAFSPPGAPRFGGCARPPAGACCAFGVGFRVSGRAAARSALPASAGCGLALRAGRVFRVLLAALLRLRCGSARHSRCSFDAPGPCWPLLALCDLLPCRPPPGRPRWGLPGARCPFGGCAPAARIAFLATLLRAPLALRAGPGAPPWARLTFHKLSTATFGRCASAADFPIVRLPSRLPSGGCCARSVNADAVLAPGLDLAGRENCPAGLTFPARRGTVFRRCPFRSFGGRPSRGVRGRQESRLV